MSGQYQQQGGFRPPPGPPPPQQYYPGPSAPYAPSAPPPNQNYGYEPKGRGERFHSKSGIKDPFFLVFFVLQFLAAIGWSGWVIYNWTKSGGTGGGGLGDNGGNQSLTLDAHTVYLLLLVTAASILLSSVYLGLVRMFTRTIMHITLVLSILLNIGICAYYWYMKYYSGAIIFTVIAIISIISYFGFRSRIPLASLLLQVVMDVANHHKAVYLVSFATLLLSAALSVWFAFATIATYQRYDPGSQYCSSSNSCSEGVLIGLIVFLSFSYIWTSQVIGNMSLATLAGGPFGGWYYFGPRSEWGAGGMPKNSTIKSLGRAFKSMGSIAFGSLIVTILEMLRLLLDMIRQNADADGQPIEALLACCAQCLVGCIESMVEYFNRYAYIEIALYGKAYIPAAKATWRLFKDRGIDALVNDSLVHTTLIWGGYLVGVLCALFGYLYLRYTDPNYNHGGNYTPVIMWFSFVIGLQCSITLTSAIDAGVSTIFVGLGEDPQVLAIRAPELFGMIAQTYPHVVQGVPR